mgnify:CR=1 FL=1
MELKVNFEDWDAQQLAPSNVVDLIWQQHLLYNKEYNQACNDLCGQVIGYDPDATLDPVANEKKIERTLISLKALFGRDFDEDVWNFKGTNNRGAGVGASVGASDARGSEQQKKSRVTFNAEVKKEDTSNKNKLPLYPHSNRDRSEVPNHNPASNLVPESRDETVSDSETSQGGILKMAASGGSQSMDTVNVRIKCFLDGKTQDTCIRVKRTTKMKKVEDCLARLMNLESGESIRFLIDGEQISPWETLQSLKIDEPDQHWFTVMPKVQ